MEVLVWLGFRVHTTHFEDAHLATFRSLAIAGHMVLVLLFLDPLRLRGALLSYYPLLLGHEVPERLTLLLILSVGPQLIAQDLVSLKSAQLEHIN